MFRGHYGVLAPIALGAWMIGCGGSQTTAAGEPTTPAETQRKGEGEQVRVEDLPPDALVDETHGFAIVPIEGWQLLGPDRVRAMSKDALGGAAKPSPLKAGLVVAERVEGLSVDEYADLVTEALPWSDVRVLRRRSLRFSGLPAVHLIVRGRAEGTPTRVEYMVVVRDGVAYQMSAIGGSGDVPDSELARFFDAVRLLRGPVELAERRRTVEEAEGPGWQIRDGVYRSAVSGVELSLPEGWRFAEANERRQINEDAEVAFRLPDHNITGVLISEPVPTPSRDSFRRFVRRMDATPVTDADADAPSLAWGPQTVELRRYEKGGMEMLHGVHCRTRVCTQVLLVYPRGERTRVGQIIGSDPPRLRTLPEPEQDRLAGELRKASGRTLVASKQVYRDHRYRHFGLGLDLEVPSDGPWQVSIGDSVRELGAGTLVYLVEPRLGIHGILMREKGSATQPASDYHTASCRAAGVEPDGDPNKLVLGDATGLRSSGRFETEIGTMRAHVVTATRGGDGIRMVVWAWPSVAGDHPDVLDRIVSGLHVHDDPPEQTLTDGVRFLDHRLGFAYRPPGSGWSQQDLTKPSKRSISSMRAWSRSDGGHVVAFAIHPPANDRDDEAMRRVLGSLLEQSRPKRRGSDVATIEVAGREAEHRSYQDPDGVRIDVVIFSHEGTMYGLVYGNLDREPEEVVAGFELVE